MNHKEIERWHRRKNIMRACQILAGVAVVLIVASYVGSSLWNDNRDDYVSVRKPGEGMRIENFSYSSVGAQPWVLQAAQAVVSESMDKVLLNLPAVTYPGGSGDKIFLNSLTGQLDKKNQDVIARGAVTIRFRDFLFSTDEVHYLHGKLLAETTSPVSVEGTDLRVTGKGLTLSIEKEEVSVEEDVKTQLFNVQWVGSNGRLPL
jgi:LPS export ABC transporter protein LptC